MGPKLQELLECTAGHYASMQGSTKADKEFHEGKLEGFLVALRIYGIGDVVRTKRALAKFLAEYPYPDVNVNKVPTKDDVARTHDWVRRCAEFVWEQA